MDSQDLAVADLAVSTSVSPVHTPPANSAFVNTTATTTPNHSAPQSPMITPNKELTAQDPVSHQLLGLAEIVQRLSDAMAASDLEMSVLKDEVYQLKLQMKNAIDKNDIENSNLKDENNQLKALLATVERNLQDANADSINKESDAKFHLRILEEENARLKAELEKATQYGGLNILKDMTRLMKKNDDLEERLPKQSDDFEKRLAENVYNLVSIQAKVLEFDKIFLPTEFKKGHYLSRMTVLYPLHRDKSTT
jgi:hypothetical protein